MYKTFTRNWWRYENGTLVPDPCARKTTRATGLTIEEALNMCERYNKENNPGPLSKKMEFETQ